MKKEGSVYICHTYYHVFVAFLKEFYKENPSAVKSDIILSTMSTDFENLADRIRESGVFGEVIFFEEKRESYFPEVAKIKEKSGNVITNMIYRIQFTRAFAKAEAEFVPVDLRKYEDIYVFCDADPIGYYLNQNRIRYHAVEDGLDTLKPVVQAKFDNRGFFALKKFFSMGLNLIFIRDGYSKYCLDMEVNDISVIDDNFRKYKEVPRNALIDALSSDEREIIIRTFVRDYDTFVKSLGDLGNSGKSILILTEPLCSLDVRKQIFRDLTDTYSKEGTVFIKPHPRDELDYYELFPEYIVFDKAIPMEIFNFFDTGTIDKIISVYTQLGSVRFAKEKIYLGDDFMDKYEDPSVHRKKEILDKKK